MGNLVKQTVNSVVFMDNMSHADDVRCLILEIDCEGAGRFFRMRTTTGVSDIYFNSPEDIRLIYETALSMWAQGDIYAPDDTEHDFDFEKSPTLSVLLPKVSITTEEKIRVVEQRHFLLGQMRRIANNPNSSAHALRQIASEAISAVRGEEISNATK